MRIRGAKNLIFPAALMSLHAGTTCMLLTCTARVLVNTESFGNGLKSFLFFPSPPPSICSRERVEKKEKRRGKRHFSSFLPFETMKMSRQHNFVDLEEEFPPPLLCKYTHEKRGQMIFFFTLQKEQQQCLLFIDPHLFSHSSSGANLQRREDTHSSSYQCKSIEISTPALLLWQVAVSLLWFQKAARARTRVTEWSVEFHDTNARNDRSLNPFHDPPLLSAVVSNIARRPSFFASSSISLTYKRVGFIMAVNHDWVSRCVDLSSAAEWTVATWVDFFWLRNEVKWPPSPLHWKGKKWWREQYVFFIFLIELR